MLEMPLEKMVQKMKPLMVAYQSIQNKKK